MAQRCGWTAQGFLSGSIPGLLPLGHPLPPKPRKSDAGSSRRGSHWKEGSGTCSPSSVKASRAADTEGTRGSSLGRFSNLYHLSCDFTQSCVLACHPSLATLRAVCPTWVPLNSRLGVYSLPPLHLHLMSNGHLELSQPRKNYSLSPPTTNAPNKPSQPGKTLQADCCPWEACRVAPDALLP